MTVDVELSCVGAHIRYASRDAVVEALVRMGVGIGRPVPVWPPRRLPFGMYLSPVRNGWISLWTPLEDTDEWLPRLTGTLECVGVVLEVVQSQFWLAEFFRHGSFVGRMELPTKLVEWDLLQAHTEASLEADGVRDWWADEARFNARLDQVAASEAYRQDVERLQDERLQPEELLPFLPPYGSAEQAWELLTAIERQEGDEQEGDEEEAGSPYAEDYMEAFASYLSIRDAAWDPRSDADALAAGDYDDEEGLPEGWREFVVLPVPQLPVL